MRSMKSEVCFYIRQTGQGFIFWLSHSSPFIFPVDVHLHCITPDDSSNLKLSPPHQPAALMPNGCGACQQGRSYSTSAHS